ncbi:hypothetical protein DFH09DRAFT_904707 [Mycena vulgaris]|nr:hypothetical protein DFH09DRAFT_904707 [Mycena vulgaris]
MANQPFRDRLADIEAQISLLEAERKILHKKLSSLIYPVLSLPFDITSEIFVQCLSDSHEFHGESQSTFDLPRASSYTPSALPAPVLLSQICRTWRSIALKTPRLWASFHVSVDRWFQNNMQLDT